MLNDHDIYKIEEFAKEKRRSHELGTGPLGDNIFKVVRSLGVQLVQFPFSEEVGNETDPFSALYLSSRENGYSICYIGVNTSEYWDKQIFAVAHELYHHYESTEPFVLCRGLDDVSEYREVKANRFAAEFLLPKERLVREIKEKNNGHLLLTKWNQKNLMRLIAELHCDYWLPYKAIVRRLYEIQAINQESLQLLLQVDARDPNGIYWVIGTNINPNIFAQLSNRTKWFGVEGENLEKLIENYEDGLVSLQELSEDLRLFGKSLENYKLMEDMIEEDDEDLSLLYKGDEGEG